MGECQLETRLETRTKCSENSKLELSEMGQLVQTIIQTRRTPSALLFYAGVDRNLILKVGIM